ncbi:hypothetical protein V6N13_038483 [Hibiscus sabdariffa]
MSEQRLRNVARRLSSLFGHIGGEHGDRLRVWCWKSFGAGGVDTWLYYQRHVAVGFKDELMHGLYSSFF